MAHDGTKLFALRVLNKTRSCVLLKKFNNNVWTFPVLEMDYDEDPMERIGEILEQVGQAYDFEFVSAVSMVEYMQEDENGNEQHSIIYDLQYKGKVLSGLTAADTTYTLSKWVPKASLELGNKTLNYPTDAFVKAAEKETCLR